MLAACAAAVARPEVRACASASRRAAETVGLVRAGSVALPVSDKIDTSGYQIMYGALLRHRRGGGGSGGGGAGGGRALRLFEVGLGCDQRYGPGASVSLWQRYLGPLLELWEGEYDASRLSVAH